MSAANLGTHRTNEGVMTLSWNKDNAIMVEEGSILFSLRFNVLKEAHLSDLFSITSEITSAEAYNAQDELIDVALSFTNPLSDEQVLYELQQNSPNPFSDETEIGFVLPYAMPATINIHNVTGQLVKRIRGEYVKGYNSIRISRKELSGNGLLYYTLETENYQATKRMVLID